jgi:hypothetical protein
MAAPLGNQNATKGRIWTEAILRALDRRAGDGRPRAEILADFADRLLGAAWDGDLNAIQELGNRIEGRPMQRIEADLTVEINVNFRRDQDEWQTIEAEATPQGLEAKVQALSQQARETMEMVLEGVPAEDQETVFDKALSTVLAASERGMGEKPHTDLLERQSVPDVAPMADGYMVNLDIETEEEKAKFEDALAKVNEHNATVLARKK